MIPGAELITIADASHMPQMERPDEFRAAIENVREDQTGCLRQLVDESNGERDRNKEGPDEKAKWLVQPLVRMILFW